MKKIKAKAIFRKLSKVTAVVLIASMMSSLLVSEQKIQAASSPRAGGSYYNYGEALQKALLFYKANRLGDLPDDYILPYRADAAMTDGQDVGLDLTGGWADAKMELNLLILYPMLRRSWAGMYMSIVMRLKKQDSWMSFLMKLNGVPIF